MYFTSNQWLLHWIEAQSSCSRYCALEECTIPKCCCQWCPEWNNCIAAQAYKFQLWLFDCVLHAWTKCVTTWNLWKTQMEPQMESQMTHSIETYWWPNQLENWPLLWSLTMTSFCCWKLPFSFWKGRIHNHKCISVFSSSSNSLLPDEWEYYLNQKVQCCC